MASISHTVGGTENLVSFKSAARVPITSLKAHFKPIQEGEGNPSPDNVRSINGWNGIEGYKCGKNLFDMNSLSNQKNIREENNFYYNTVADTRDYTNIYLEFWDVLSTTFVTRLQNVAKLLSSNGKTSFVFTIKEECKDAKVIRIKYNGQKQDFIIGTWSFNLQIGHTYTCSMDVTGFDATVIGGFSVGNIQIEEGSIATEYEPYHGGTIPVTFPVLGKNKFNPEMEWTVGKTYTYAYLPELENLCNISFTLKDSTIDVSDISVGFSYYEPNAVSEINKGYRWCLSRGVINTYAKTNTVRDGNSAETKGKICIYLVVNSSSQAAFQDKYNRLISAYDIQIEYGDTATTYEPYNSNNTVYGGYVDLAKGELVQEWVKYTLTGEDINAFHATSSNYGQWWLWVYQLKYLQKRAKVIDSNPSNQLMCDMFTVNNKRGLPSDGSPDYIISTWGGSSGNDGSQFCFRGVPSDKNELITFLDEYKPSIAYFLENPVTYPLSSQELTTFLNQNNIWTSTNDVTEVSYAIHDTAPIRAARKRIQAAAPGLKTQEGEMINFETDVPAPLKECKAYFKPKQDFNGYDRPWIGGGGKNLLNPASFVRQPGTTSGNTFEVINDTMTMTWVNGAIIANAKQQIIKAGTYTITGFGTNVDLINARISASDDYSILYTTRLTALKRTFTVEKDFYIELFGVYNNPNTAVFQLQLEAGSTATSYAPYENICPIEGWESFEATRCGKNLCNENTLLNGYIRGAVTSTGTEIGAFGSSSEWIATDFIKVLPNTVYTINFTWVMALAAGLAFYKEPIVNSAISGIPTIQMGKAPYTFTTPSECNYIRFSSHKEDDTVMSLELGDTATDYEPYNGTTIPITFPTEAGTIYGGYVDLVKGEIVQEWYTISIDETAPMRAYNSDARNQGTYCNASYWLSTFNAPNGASYEPYSYDGFCDKLVYYENNYAQNSRAMAYNSTVDICLEGVRSQEDFLAWLTENGPITICYRLKDPIHYPVSPTVLKTLRGTNNIWSSANDKIEIKYWRH